jgi:hypothetical protein
MPGSFFDPFRGTDWSRRRNPPSLTVLDRQLRIVNPFARTVNLVLG